MLSIISTLLKYVGILISVSFPQRQRLTNTNGETDPTVIAASVKDSGDTIKLVRTDSPTTICYVSRKSSHQLLKTRSKKNIVSPSYREYKYNGKKGYSELCRNRTSGFPEQIKIGQMLKQNQLKPIWTHFHRMQRGDVDKSDDPSFCLYI